MKYWMCSEQVVDLARVAGLFFIENCYNAPVDEEAESNMIEHKNQHKYPFL